MLPVRGAPLVIGGKTIHGNKMRGISNLLFPTKRHPHRAFIEFVSIRVRKNGSFKALTIDVHRTSHSFRF